MATAPLGPVELPTSRQSRYMTYDRDPWSPANSGNTRPRPLRQLTSESDTLSRSTVSSTARLPPARYAPREPRTMAGRDPTELQPQELDVGPAGAFLPKTAYQPEPRSRQASRSHKADSSDDTGTVVSDSSTSSAVQHSDWSATTLDGRFPSELGLNTPKEDKQMTHGPSSRRSSLVSTNNRVVPTSRFNRKKSNATLGGTATPSAPSTPVLPQAPGEMPQLESMPPDISPRSRPSTDISRSSTVRTTGAQSLADFSRTGTVKDSGKPPAPVNHPGIPELPPMPAWPEPTTASPVHQNRKSTVSVRRARALGSHPWPNSRQGSSETVSTPKPRSPPESPPPVESFPVPPQRTSRRSQELRRSIHELPPPSAAPSEPLPQLPPAARAAPPKPVFVVRPRTSTRSLGSPIGVEHPSPAPPKPTTSHKELASFMATKSTLVFRRFDEVHVRLLLTLQDEISALERELQELERTEKTENEAHRVKVLSELRKLLAEYDHLFANWNLMQASKADESTKVQLAAWLTRDGAGATGTLSQSARDDLEWLQRSHDLSAVNLKAVPDPKPMAHQPATTARQIQPTGIASWFACGGRRG